MQVKKRFVIGIDPGVKTGLSIYDRVEKRLKCCETSDFWNVLDAVKSNYYRAECVIYVEDASLIHHTFHVGNADKKKGYNDQISRNVGRVQRESELLIEGFERAGYEVVRVKPEGKKWDIRTFRVITKWSGNASNHARDAARMCFGL